MAIAQKFKAKLTTAQLSKVEQVCKNLKIDPNWLLAVMYFESGGTFSPAKRNPIGSVGLIQFTRDKAGVQYKTIGGVKYMLDTLAKMTFVQQMDVVEKYYKEAKGSKSLNSFIDTYLVTFFPAALGKASDYVFATKNLAASLIARQNPAFDRNKDGVIHKGEVVDYFRQMYNAQGFDFDSEINSSKTRLGLGAVAMIAAVFFYTVTTVNWVVLPYLT